MLQSEAVNTAPPPTPMKILYLYATIRNPFSSVCGKYIYIFNNWGMAIVQYVDETFHLTMPELSLPVVLQHLWCVGGELLCGEEPSPKGCAATESFDLEYLLQMSPDLMRVWSSSGPDLFRPLILFKCQVTGPGPSAAPSVVSLPQVTFSLVPLWLTNTDTLSSAFSELWAHNMCTHVSAQRVCLCADFSIPPTQRFLGSVLLKP